MDEYSYLTNAGSFMKELSDFVQTCEILFWISIIINVIVLICFFILCANVAKIKKEAHNVANFEARFNFLYGIGELKEAKKLLLKRVQMMDNASEAFYCKQDYKKNSRNYIDEKFKVYFDKLDIHIDYDKIDELIEEELEK